VKVSHVQATDYKYQIVGASGGVGTVAVQLLKAWGHEVRGYQSLFSFNVDKF